MPRKGWRHSEESKAKMSASKKGRSPSLEHRAKLSEAMKGKANHKPTPAIDRALAQIVVSDTGCWEYQGTIGPRGYGQIGEGRALKFQVHRLVYEHKVGPIPEGLTIDHLCFNTRCCNPEHLEAVTREENTRRQWEAGRADPGKKYRDQTHCKRGHEFTEENTRHYNGRRHCRTCARDYQRERWRRDNGKV